MKLSETFKVFTKISLKFSKGNLFELCLFILFLFIAFIFRESPPQNKLKPAEINSSKLPKETDLSNDTNTSIDINISKEKRESSNSTYALLKKRNPFSPEGSYLDKEIPENPYKLIALKFNSQKEAILNFFTGELLKVKEGTTLPDGSKVIKITKNSVILERLGKKRELKIFEVKVEKWKPRKPFGLPSS